MAQKNLGPVLAVALFLLSAGGWARAQVATTPQIAFTFDDLPIHGPLPPGETRLEVGEKILEALKKAEMPPVYGFVNGHFTEKEPGDIEVLKAWRKAGYPLGNHTWSHPNLQSQTLEAYQVEIARNEPLLAELMKDEDWRWFRFPFLSEGDTPEKRVGVRAFLRQHGYKVAGVTMSFGDYMWNEPYARCKAKGDSKAVASLEASYLSAADDSITYYRQLSHALYGRDIPYVLLMHIGAFDAEMLPRLLDLYRTRGFQFVTLPEAEKDDFYREDTDLALPPGPDMLEEVMGERHLPLPTHPAATVQLDSLCR
jgi:peptidoglycan-N-acetylglucosamine deacetylase